MRQISAKIIEDAVADLAARANIILRKDVLSALKSAREGQTNRRAKELFEVLLENAAVARDKKIALCQDTGMPLVFVELGQDVHIGGGGLNRAINRGIDKGYKRGLFRRSVVADPVRRGPQGYGPAVTHIEIVAGARIRLSVLPKGFGCENKARVKMFNPTAELPEINDFIVGVVRDAGADACPPYIVAVGIGGTQDYACLLAKKALLKTIRRPVVFRGLRPPRRAPGDSRRWEQELLREINRLDIGPMGLGRKTCCLGVNIETYPTHIAGLPVAVNISCHSLRSATAVI